MKIDNNKYSLTLVGLAEVESFLPIIEESEDQLIEDATTYLRKYFPRINSEEQRNFIGEAVACLRIDARRACIIMIWSATIDHLYEFILTHKLNDFNAALRRRPGRYSTLIITTKEDFHDIRDQVFIEVCRSSNIISNDVRKILDEKLGIRNSCAHPSLIKIHLTKVVNFIEDLIDNVIIKYPI
jgi:hypothetical protein